MARAALPVAVVGVGAALVGLAIGGGDARVLPVEAAAHFDEPFQDRAASYAGLKYSYWATATIVRWGTLAALILLGGGLTLASWVRRLARGRPVLTAFGATALLLLLLDFAVLPISFASGYRAEHAFGLSTQTAGGWALDWVRRNGFWTVIHAVLAAGFLACLRRWPRHGWLAAGLGGVLVAILGTFVAPRVIDPLFHDFARLDDPLLEREIVALGERAGLDIGRVQVMDASRRTRRLNAYVTGLGATRQVVLYDNLLADAPPDEIRLVVAHEVAHAAEDHVRRGLLWSVPGILIGAWALAALARRRADRDPRLESAADPAGVPLLWLATSVLLFLSSPLSSALSRGMEAEADWISLELTGDPDTFVAVEKRLTKANLSPVTPPGWIVSWFYSHPPILDRIGMAEYWRQMSDSQD